MEARFCHYKKKVSITRISSYRSRNFDLFSRNLDLLTPNFEKITRNFELISQNVKNDTFFFFKWQKQASIHICTYSTVQKFQAGPHFFMFSNKNGKQYM